MDTPIEFPSATTIDSQLLGNLPKLQAPTQESLEPRYKTE